MDLDGARLAGDWVHVHEEDDARHLVFRRVGTPLPPSRGRAGYRVAADLTARRTGPGADDRPVVQGLYRLTTGTAAADQLRVTDTSNDRLIIARDGSA